MTETLIQLQNVTRDFGSGEARTHALRGVSLEITDGEFVAIQGPSGSGKSTLLSIIGLLDSPSRGNYHLRGQAVTALAESQLAILRNRHLGWIFQNFRLIGELSVLDNVLLPLRYDRRQRRPVPLATAVLERVGLGDKLSALPNQLSGGQQQRVAIARALVNRPDLLLADEPTGNLDSASGHSIMALLSELAEEGATVLVVTHDDAVAAYCRRHLSLADGSLVDDRRTA